MVSVFFRGKKVQPSLVWLFYAGFFLVLLAGSIYRSTELMPPAIFQIRQILRVIGMGFLALRLLSFLFQDPRYTLTCICILVALRLSFILSEPTTERLYRVALVVAASRGTDIRLSLKLYLAYLVFFLIACPTFFLAGWTDNVVTHIGQYRGGSYGFGNPNSLASFLALTVFLTLYLLKERRVAVICAVCWSAAALTEMLTLCQTQTVLLLVMPVIYFLILKTRPKPWLFAVLPVLCVIVSIGLAFYYGPGYGSSTFESRFSIPALVYEQYGLSLFGQDCGLLGWFNGVYPYNLVIDNAFLNLIVCKGVVISIVAVAFLAHLLFLLGKKGDPLLAAIACCIVISGMMECSPLFFRYSILPLLYIPLVGKDAPARGKTNLAVSFGLVSSIALYLFMPWHPHRVQPHPYGTVGEIPCPDGFKQAEYDPDSFSGYVESLPLARPDSVLTGFDGTSRDTLARFCYRVVDFPLMDENEQCADVCMRLRAEYLYGENRFRKIGFADTRGYTLRYRFGACRPLFDRYLKEVFAWGNTESMCHSMPLRQMEDLVPGDVFVYEKDARLDEKYGHAVMVAAVAADTSGRKAVLLIQGSTPACDIHVVANPEDLDLSPWFLLQEPEDASAPVVSVGNATFYAEDIRYFRN